MLNQINRRGVLKFLTSVTSLLVLIPSKILYAAGQNIVQKDGIYKIKGDVNVNGTKAMEGQIIQNGDKIQTGNKSYLIFIAQRSVYKLRPNSNLDFKVKLEKDKDPLHVIGLIRGGLLSVFPPGLRKSINTRTASIGIRGSGAYTQIENGDTYFCLCYGEAFIKLAGENKVRKSIKTVHHESPVMITSNKKINVHKMKGHSDKELIFLESLVGRDVPFSEDDGYMDGY